MSDGLTNERSGGWARAIDVTAVVLLLLYPLAACGGGSATAKQAEAQKALQTSLEAYQAGRYQDAVTAAKAALAANPNLAEAHNNLAVSYLQLRRFDEATQAAEQALRLSPGFQLAKNNLAWIQREQAAAGSPGAASPTSSANALVTQSAQHAQAGRFKECMDAGSQAAKLNPASPQAFSNVGFCAWRLHLWDEAIRNTQEAIRLDPNFQMAKNNLAAIQKEKLTAEGPTAK